jgi:hypothetical protein
VSPALLRFAVGCCAPLDDSVAAFPVRAFGSTLVDVDPVPPWHAVKHTLVVVGPAVPRSACVPGSPLSPSSLPPGAAPVGMVEQAPPAISEDELCSLPDLGDERLSPKVLLHNAYEVVSQLERAEEFHSLSSNELELRDFLKDPIVSL